MSRIIPPKPDTPGLFTMKTSMDPEDKRNTIKSAGVSVQAKREGWLSRAENSDSDSEDEISSDGKDKMKDIMNKRKTIKSAGVNVQARRDFWTKKSVDDSEQQQKVVPVKGVQSNKTDMDKPEAVESSVMNIETEVEDENRKDRAESEGKLIPDHADESSVESEIGQQELVLATVNDADVDTFNVKDTDASIAAGSDEHLADGSFSEENEGSPIDNNQDISVSVEYEVEANDHIKEDIPDGEANMTAPTVSNQTKTDPELGTEDTSQEHVTDEEFIETGDRKAENEVAFKDFKAEQNLQKQLQELRDKNEQLLMDLKDKDKIIAEQAVQMKTFKLMSKFNSERELKITNLQKKLAEYEQQNRSLSEENDTLKQQKAAQTENES